MSYVVTFSCHECGHEFAEPYQHPSEDVPSCPGCGSANYDEIGFIRHPTRAQIDAAIENGKRKSEATFSDGCLMRRQAQ